jgi:NAD(P)-dependent dehydrogenase (short-subunit alcohol dehydrogenase family)
MLELCVAHCCHPRRLVINHAYIPLELIDESNTNMAVFEQVVETNYVASARLLRHMLPLLTSKARLGIVASAGLHFYPGFLSAYLSSKAAIVTFAEGKMEFYSAC